MQSCKCNPIMIVRIGNRYIAICEDGRTSSCRNPRLAGSFGCVSKKCGSSVSWPHTHTQTAQDLTELVGLDLQSGGLHLTMYSVTLPRIGKRELGQPAVKYPPRSSSGGAFLIGRLHDIQNICNRKAASSSNLGAIGRDFAQFAFSPRYDSKQILSVCESLLSDA